MTSIRVRKRRHWHGHGDVVSQPRLYEITSKLAFLGRRNAIYDEILDAAQLRAGARVLDVGTGPGHLAKRAARRVGPTGRVIGIDPSQNAVAAASRHRRDNLAFEEASAEELPFEEQTFDVVVLMLALHHIGSDNVSRALSEIHRVLKPGGRLVVADFLEARAVHASRRPQPPGSAQRHRPIPDLDELLVGAGFHVSGRGSHGHGIDHMCAVRPGRRTPGP
jgi:ubiquinone/menaquinone biosynthesis C-methylase UbiE